MELRYKVKYRRERNTKHPDKLMKCSMLSESAILLSSVLTMWSSLMRPSSRLTTG